MCPPKREKVWSSLRDMHIGCVRKAIWNVLLTGGASRYCTSAAGAKRDAGFYFCQQRRAQAFRYKHPLFAAYFSGDLLFGFEPSTGRTGEIGKEETVARFRNLQLLRSKC